MKHGGCFLRLRSNLLFNKNAETMTLLFSLAKVPQKGRLKPVKNEDLWRTLDSLLQSHDVVFTRIKGHSGHPENERCDELAVLAAQQAKDSALI